MLLSQLGAAAALAAADVGEPVDSLISRGLDLRRNGKPTEALQLFEQAHASAPSPRTAGNLGLTEASLERWVEASEHLDAALAAPEDSWIQKNQRGLQQALELARQHVGEILISGPAGAAVTVGGRSVGTLPISRPIRVIAGTSKVRAVARDYQPYEVNVAVGAGDHASLNLVLTKIATVLPASEPTRERDVPPPILPPPATPTPDHQRTWKTGVGVGLLVGATGLLTLGVSWIAVDGNSTSCMRLPGAMCPAYDTGTKGWALFGVGAAAAVAGGVVLYLDRSGRRNDLAIHLNPTSALLVGRF